MTKNEQKAYNYITQRAGQTITRKQLAYNTGVKSSTLYSI